MADPNAPCCSNSPYISTTGEYTWRVENFSKLPQKLYSDTFIVGTREWRLLLFPKGNPSAGVGDCLALYLDYPEASVTPHNLCPKARFDLEAVNQENSGDSNVKESLHTFTETENDWGYTRFLHESELPKGFVVDDAIILKVRISLEEDRYRRGQLARGSTGCVGVWCETDSNNLEAWSSGLCALVQCLYHLPLFRKAVYQLPADIGEGYEFARELRRIFFQLQYSETSVVCDQLTEAAGCPENIADIAELAQDLESKLSGTGADSMHDELFVGKARNFLHTDCNGGETVTSKEEQFVDLNLDVEGFSNIYGSFLALFKEEILEGNNRIEVDGHGLVNGRRYTRLDHLPPILRLQPKRFTYNPNSNSVVKVNGEFEFYSILDLTDYLDQIMCHKAVRPISSRYMLHTVVVHLGSPLGGSYCVFIRGKDKTSWVKLDEDTVSTATEEEAIKRHYGSKTATDATAVSTAVVLGYVHEDEWDRIMSPVDKSAIPETVRQDLQKELEEMDRDMANSIDRHLYVDACVVREDDLERLSDTVNCFHLVCLDKEVKRYRLHKKSTVGDIKRKIARDMGMPPKSYRLWLWSKMQAGVGVLRVSHVPPDSSQLISLKQHRCNSDHSEDDGNVLMTLPFYLHEHDFLTRELHEDKILLFFKHYNPFQQSLQYVGERSIAKHWAIGMMWDDLCDMAGLELGTEICLYGDPKNGVGGNGMAALDVNKSPYQLGLDDGDVLCIQQQCRFQGPGIGVRSVLEHMNYWRDRLILICKPLRNQDPEFDMEVFTNEDYKSLCNEIALYLGLDDWRQLRLWRGVSTKSNNFEKIEYNSQNINFQTDGKMRTTILYEVLDLPVPVIETRFG